LIPRLIRCDEDVRGGPTGGNQTVQIRAVSVSTVAVCDFRRFAAIYASPARRRAKALVSRRNNLILKENSLKSAGWAPLPPDQKLYHGHIYALVICAPGFSFGLGAPPLSAANDRWRRHAVLAVALYRRRSAPMSPHLPRPA
jgi:hypothetical protein